MINRIVLASSSPRRKEILERFNVKFDVIPSDAEEIVDEYTSNGDYVRQLAILKGKSVIKDLNKKGIDTSDTLVISCDTVVVHNDKIIGKPKDLDDAYNTVMELSDSWHSVYSGLSLILNNKEYSGFDETKVKFVKIDPNEAKVYVESGEPMGKAGSYAIQMKGGAFVSGVEGDFNNIVGFPLTLFCKVLKEEFNISIFELGNL